MCPLSQFSPRSLGFLPVGISCFSLPVCKLLEERISLLLCLVPWNSKLLTEMLILLSQEEFSQQVFPAPSSWMRKSFRVFLATKMRCTKMVWLSRLVECSQVLTIKQVCQLPIRHKWCVIEKDGWEKLGSCWHDSLQSNNRSHTRYVVFGKFKKKRHSTNSSWIPTSYRLQTG